MNQPGMCSMCGGPIKPDRDYRKVTGYERHRSQGGTNAIRLRQTHDEWACTTCIDRASKGVAPTQGTLI